MTILLHFLPSRGLHSRGFQRHLPTFHGQAWHRRCGRCQQCTSMYHPQPSTLTQAVVGAFHPEESSGMRAVAVDSCAVHSPLPHPSSTLGMWPQTQKHHALEINQQCTSLAPHKHSAQKCMDISVKSVRTSTIDIGISSHGFASTKPLPSHFGTPPSPVTLRSRDPALTV
jgi:hypothetical protein